MSLHSITLPALPVCTRAFATFRVSASRIALSIVRWPHHSTNSQANSQKKCRLPRHGSQFFVLRALLAARGDVGVAWTEGMQKGDDDRFVKVAVTLKHFIANTLEVSHHG